MRIVIALLVVTTVLGLTHWYLWSRLVKATTRTRRWRIAGAIAVVALAILPWAAVVSTRATSLPMGLRHVLEWVGYVWMAVLFYLVVALLALELVRLVAWLAGRSRSQVATPMPGVVVPSGDLVTTAEPEVVGAAVGRAASAESMAMATDGPQVADAVGGAGSLDPDPASAPTEAANGIDRRLLLGRTLAVGAGLIAVGTVGYGMKQAFSRPRIEHVPIKLTKLNPALNGYRIGVVSDIHLGPFVQRGRVQMIVNMLNRLDVSSVAIVGDLVDGSVEELGGYAEPLAELTAPDGTFFVTGNHEYYSGVEDWVEFLPSLGIQVLRNERIRINHGDAGFDLAGVNDISAENMEVLPPDLPKALRGRNEQDPVVLLSHQPVMFDDAVKHGVDLQLSGHTHGGQMWPFNYLVRLEQPVVSGHAKVGKSQLYVTRGVGFWGPPVRVGAPPEISVIELQAA